MNYENNGYLLYVDHSEARANLRGQCSLILLPIQRLDRHVVLIIAWVKSGKVWPILRHCSAHNSTKRLLVKGTPSFDFYYT